MGELIYLETFINGQRRRYPDPRFQVPLDASREPQLKRITQKTGWLARLRRDLGEVLFNRAKGREGSPRISGRD